MRTELSEQGLAGLVEQLLDEADLADKAVVVDGGTLREAAAALHTLKETRMQTHSGLNVPGYKPQGQDKIDLVTANKHTEEPVALLVGVFLWTVI